MKETTKMFMVVDFKPYRDEFRYEVIVKCLTISEVKAKRYAQANNYYFYEVKQLVCFNETRKQFGGKSIHRMFKYDDPCCLWTKNSTSPIWIEELGDFGKDLWCSIFEENIDGKLYRIPMEKPVNEVIGIICCPNKPITQLTDEDKVSELMFKYVKRRLGGM